MKNLIYLFTAILVVAAASTSCSDDKDDNNNEARLISVAQKITGTYDVDIEMKWKNSVVTDYDKYRGTLKITLSGTDLMFELLDNKSGNPEEDFKMSYPVRDLNLKEASDGEISFRGAKSGTESVDGKRLTLTYTIDGEIDAKTDLDITFKKVSADNSVWWEFDVDEYMDRY